MLGNGYGGFVALQMAIRHPGLVRGLVLADCGACFSEPGRQAFRAMAAGVEAGGPAKIADVAMRRLFAPEFQDAHPDLMAERRAAFLRTAPDVLVAACHALATLDLRAEVGQVRVPVLVLVGEQDEATPPAMSRELAALLPDARLVVLDGCAHVPQLQDPTASWRRSTRSWVASEGPLPGGGFRWTHGRGSGPCRPLEETAEAGRRQILSPLKSSRRSAPRDGTRLPDASVSRAPSVRRTEIAEARATDASLPRRRPGLGGTSDRMRRGGSCRAGPPRGRRSGGPGSRDYGGQGEGVRFPPCGPSSATSPMMLRSFDGRAMKVDGRRSPSTSRMSVELDSVVIFVSECEHECSDAHTFASCCASWRPRQDVAAPRPCGPSDGNGADRDGAAVVRRGRHRRLLRHQSRAEGA